VARRTRISAGIVVAAIGLAVLALLAAGCGGGSGASAAPPSTTTGTATPGGGGPNAAAFQAYRDCLSAHGVTLPARPPGGGGAQGGTPPAGQAGAGAQGRFGNLTAKQRAAMAACQSKRPAGAGFGGGGANRGQANPAFAKYTACLKSHGVTFGSTSPSSSTFTKATAACKSLLPTNAGGSGNGGTTTTTTP
jgi:hypothetical protein